MAKQIIYSDHSRQALLRGVNQLAEAVKVKPHADWPDYVFASGYDLTELKKVERFILENKHLPDVPSASDIKKDGLDLGAMNAVLLKKVEELTLYIIDLKKDVEQLKAEKAAVKQ